MQLLSSACMARALRLCDDWHADTPAGGEHIQAIEEEAMSVEAPATDPWHICKLLPLYVTVFNDQHAFQGSLQAVGKSAFSLIAARPDFMFALA